MKRRQKRNMMLLGLILALHFIYILAGLGLRKAGIQLNLRWLFWNLGLAFMPVALAVPAYLLTSWRRHWGPISLGLAIGWLLFLPNACYMVTDLIHLQGSQLIGGNGVYLQSLSGWVRLIYIVGGILMALVDGLFSTSLIHQNVKWRRNKVFNFCWMSVISLLCGYGVYIGRFLRLNTWDVLQPKTLMTTLLTNIDKFTILFSFMLAAFYFAAYFIFDKLMRSEPHA